MKAEEFKRIVDEKPALVVWQAGTVDAMRGDPDDFRAVLDTGFETLQANGADVVLMNTQYSPRTDAMISMARSRHLCLLTLAPALLLAALASPAQAQTHYEGAVPVCGGPAGLVHFNRALPRLAERLALRGPVTIVAIGSSSTAGAGASSVVASYPSRLEAMLQAKFPGVPITVLNRGVNGEEVGQMLARFDSAVIAEKPDLVLWQIGTNSVLRDRDISGNAPLLADGLKRLKATGADVVLINPQYAPKVLAKANVEPMVHLISAIAKESGVELFNRFAVMRYWHEAARIPFESFLSPDQLHMNDWGYDCIARLLSDAIVGSVTLAPQTASAPAVRRQ